MIKEENLSDVNDVLNKKFHGKIMFIEELLSNNTKYENQSIDVTSDKIIQIDYKYDHVMIETQFSFANALWNGNNAYIKVNDQIYWMDQHDWIEEDSIEGKNLFHV